MGDELKGVLRLSAEIFVKVIEAYIQAFEPLIRLVLRVIGREDLLPQIIRAEGIDERIRKLDMARENLVSGLHAIDELKAMAEVNKRDLSEVLARLEMLRQEKDLTERQLEEIKKIAGSDVETFQRIAGVPSSKDKWVERSIGFTAGFVASVLATLALGAF
ncbi:MAG: hypothetical protein VW600_14100 [Ferrovibrio sp.]